MTQIITSNYQGATRNSLVPANIEKKSRVQVSIRTAQWKAVWSLRTSILRTAGLTDPFTNSSDHTISKAAVLTTPHCTIQLTTMDTVIISTMTRMGTISTPSTQETLK